MGAVYIDNGYDTLIGIFWRVILVGSSMKEDFFSKKKKKVWKIVSRLLLAVWKVFSNLYLFFAEIVFA